MRFVRFAAPTRALPRHGTHSHCSRDVLHVSLPRVCGPCHHAWFVVFSRLGKLTGQRALSSGPIACVSRKRPGGVGAGTLSGGGCRWAFRLLRSEAGQADPGRIAKNAKPITMPRRQASKLSICQGQAISSHQLRAIAPLGFCHSPPTSPKGFPAAPATNTQTDLWLAPNFPLPPRLARPQRPFYSSFPHLPFPNSPIPPPST